MAGAVLGEVQVSLCVVGAVPRGVGNQKFLVKPIFLFFKVDFLIVFAKSILKKPPCTQIATTKASHAFACLLVLGLCDPNHGQNQNLPKSGNYKKFFG